MKKNILSVVALMLTAQIFAQITTGTLLEQMSDRKALSESSNAEYRSVQFSSFDRESIYENSAEGSYRPESGRDWGKGWFANHDFYQFIRDEKNLGRIEHVLMDQKGPGAVVRFWSALGGRHWNEDIFIRVYLDDSEVPQIEMRFKDFIGGSGFIGEPFSYLASDKSTNTGWRGRNLYFPIPFSKNCKITMDDSSFGEEIDWGGFYYHINCRLYNSGTDVKTFSKSDLTDYRDYIGKSSEILTKDSIIHEKLTRPVRIKSGEIHEVKLSGAKAITDFSFGLKALDLKQARKSTIIELVFDGEVCLRMPVAAFFGCGYRGQEHQTLFSAVKSKGIMRSMWFMPFKNEAVIRIINRNKSSISLTNLNIETEPYAWTDSSMHFHGTWFELRNLDTNLKRDINFVQVEGEGLYVGDTLTIFNTYPDWWGEGDEKIFVDGESFPSHFGTGTEDYYGYAWCRPQPFSRPFHSQPCGKGNKAVGESTNNRVRTLDAIPFKKSISVNMELWHPFYGKMNYAPGTFWYAKPGAKCNIKFDYDSEVSKVAKFKWDVK